MNPISLDEYHKFRWIPSGYMNKIKLDEYHKVRWTM